jgi:hypothetical protein
MKIQAFPLRLIVNEHTGVWDGIRCTVSRREVFARGQQDPVTLDILAIKQKSSFLSLETEILWLCLDDTETRIVLEGIRKLGERITHVLVLPIPPFHP